jgi:raffinose/stachyose/melibiose transport system substrate-binding protein
MTLPVSRTLAPLAGALLVASLLLSSCAGEQSAGHAPATLRIWYSTDDPVERQWTKELVRRFEAADPSIPVRLTDYSFEDLNSKLQLALSAGNPPDLAYVTPRGPGIPAYVAAHELRDLTPEVRKYRWANRLRPGLLTQYNFPFSFLGAQRGHVVAAPMALAAVGILYNKTLLARLHLSIPTSLPAFESALARARAAGYTPLGMGNADGWLGDDWYLTLVNALVRPSSLQAEQRLAPGFSFRRPAFLTAARTLQRWANLGYFTQDFGGLDAQEGVDLFFHGKTLFQLVSSSEDSQIRQDQRQTGLPIGIFAFPGPQGGGVMPQSGYEGWVVPAASRHAQEAIAFLNFVLTRPTAAFLLQQGALPAYRLASTAGVQAAWQREYVRALNSTQPGVYLDAAPVANLNATMEANVQLLLQGYETPQFLVKSLQEDYASRGKSGSTARIDGEF